MAITGFIQAFHTLPAWVTIPKGERRQLITGFCQLSPSTSIAKQEKMHLLIPSTTMSENRYYRAFQLKCAD
jgi:hypothetical protein